MIDLIARSVRVGLVFVLFSILYTLFNLWWGGVLDVYPLLVGVYAMTVVSVVPYVVMNIATAVRNRNDGKWIVTAGLSVTLMASLVAALAKLAGLRSAVTPFTLSQLRYDSSLALSLALLGLATLVYLGGVGLEGKRLAKAMYLSIVGDDEDDDEEVAAI